MSNLTMIIYSEYDGVESTVVWRNEEQFQQVKKFLQGMGLHVSGVTSEGERTRAAFVYMKTEQQYKAMCEFSHSLEENEAT
ncbi:MAG: hypothetical protein WB764_25340 [Xanthobacteraceae bacterium]